MVLRLLSIPLSTAAGALAACTSSGAGAPQAPIGRPAPAAAQEPRAEGPPPWGSAAARDHLLPAAEILTFQFLLNRYDRAFAEDGHAYAVDAQSLRRNLEGGWSVDRDPFGVNQLGHPYTGAIYHGFARSTGHDFWASSAYTFGGSLLWELAGETSPPSINDQIHTAFGGAFLGEAFFRTASWLLAPGGRTPGALRELGAFALSPPTGFNRAVFCDRFRGVFPNRGPAVASRIAAGVEFDLEREQTGQTGLPEEADAALQFAVEYGLPGEPGYHYQRPFDHFGLAVSALSEDDNLFDRVIARGLLVGAEYGDASRTCGVHGLFGSYDYHSPGLFRIASTALSYGTVARTALWDGATLRWTALGGIGFGAAGTVEDDFEDRDYHHGAVPQAAVEMRVQQSDRVSLHLGVRDFHVIGTGSEDGYSDENVLQAEIAVTMRVAGPHALRVEYVTSRRHAQFDVGADRDQTVSNLFVFYDFLGSSRL